MKNLTSDIKKINLAAGAGFFMTLLAATSAYAQDSNLELAKKLTNPVSNLVSFPIQINFDNNIGAADGNRITTNLQPVVPISLNDDWLLVSRTILPLISQNDVPTSGIDISGIGDITESVFISPKETVALNDDGKALIWAVGGAFLLPTGNDDRLSAKKWAAGPSFIALVQDGSWSYGGLVNHVWSFAGDDAREGISSTYLNPTISYTTKSAWTLNANMDITYDWKHENWSVPASFMLSHVTKIGKQPISVAGGFRYWFDAPDSGPEGLGARLTINLLFPK